MAHISVVFFVLAAAAIIAGVDAGRNLHFNGGNSAGRAVAGGTTSTGDRNSAGEAAAHDAISRAAAGDLKSSLATSIASKAAYMSTRRSAGLKTFDSISSGGRRLQDSGTTSNSDRVQLALAAAADTIGIAAGSGASLQSSRAATSKSIALARLAGRLNARGGDFGSP